MGVWAVVLSLIVLGIPLAEYLKRKGRCSGGVVYTWPWNWLVEKVNKYAYFIDWRLVGDMAVVLLVGPILGLSLVERKKESFAFFLSFSLFLFVLLPLLGGTFLFDKIALLPVVSVFLLGFSGYALLLLGSSAYSILLSYFHGHTPAPGIGLAIPGTSIGPVRIPLVEGIIALLLALLFHEGFHGVVSVREGIPVRKGGILTLGLLPIGAYVEPDEKIFQRSSLLSRARVLAAGPLANMLVFSIFVLLLLALFPISSFLSSVDCAHSSGVRILSVPEALEVDGIEIPSAAYGILEANDVIVEINGERVRCVSEFFEILSPVREKEANVSLSIRFLHDGVEKNATITTVNGFIGIRGVENVYSSPLPWWYNLLSFLVSLVSWIAFLNFMIGLVNMLPLPPLDGGLLYSYLSRETGREWLYRALLYTTVVVLLVNAAPWFIKI